MSSSEMPVDLQLGFGRHQSQIERGDFQQLRVGGGPGVELAGRGPLPRGQRLEIGVAQVAEDLHGRKGDGCGRQRARAPPP